MKEKTQQLYSQLSSQASPFQQKQTSAYTNTSQTNSLKLPLSLFHLQHHSQIFSSKIISHPNSALTTFNQSSIQKLEEMLSQMEEKLKKSERNFERKINCLVSKLNKENDRQQKFKEEIVVLQKQLSSNLKLIDQLKSKIYSQDYPEPELTPSLRPHFRKPNYFSLKKLLPKH